MTWKQRQARKAAARRHARLLRVAKDVVSQGVMDRRFSGIDLKRIVAIAFARYELRITEDEALDYLNGILAEYSLPLRYVDALPQDATIPGQRDGQDGDE
jgi:hypothetical protein